MIIFEWLQKIFLSRDEDDARIVFVMYVLVTAIFLIGFSVIYMRVMNDQLEPGTTFNDHFMTMLSYYFWAIVVIRFGFAIIDLVRGFYAGPAGGTGSNKYRDIETLVAKGLYRQAIREYEMAYRDNKRDYYPLIRIGEIYRDYLSDYKSAIRKFCEIAGSTNRRRLKLRMFEAAVNIYRANLPQSPAYRTLASRLIRDYPRSKVVKKLKEHFTR